METELQFIHHAGYRVAVLSGNPRASGMPLVFLHGIAGSVDFWPALLPPSLKYRRRWHSIGLPGHFPGGVSLASNCDSNISPDLFAEILSVVLKRLTHWQPVALIGYSTGGFAALNLAAREPQLVANVVSVSGFSVGKWRGLLGPLQGLAGHSRIGRRAFATLWSVVTSNRLALRKLVLRTAKKLEPPSPEQESLIALLMRDAKQQDPAMMADLFANIRRFDIRPLLGDMCVPTLIAGGDLDPIVPYQHTCELASTIPGAELIAFQGVGHLFFVECSTYCQQMLEDWVDRHCSSHELRRAA